jgi:hypothetical protein
LKRGILHPLLITIVLALCGTNPVVAEADQEIQHLLKWVAGSGCTFTRNGTAHASADAADHLRLKYNKGRRYAGTAEQFIDRLASESSWTDKPYTVDCDGQVETSNAWLHRELLEYRQALLDTL